MPEIIVTVDTSGSTIDAVLLTGSAAAENAKIAAQLAAASALASKNTIDQVDIPAAIAAAAETAADLVLTNADVVLTHADVVLTHADVVLTNADVVQTASDKTATAANLADTNQDSIDTALDLVATNADVVTTGIKVGLTNADVVLTNADVVSTVANILYSEEWANKGEDSLVSAAAGGDAATEYSSKHHALKSAASASASAANLANTNQDTIDTAADLVATNQDTLDTAADRTQTALDVIATAADRVATAQDVVTAAADVVTSASNVASAAAILDSFDDVYLGAKTSDPSLDNDGATLQEGALYYYTATLPANNIMKVYNGSSWIAAYASASGGLQNVNNLSDVSNAVTATQNLGVEIGVDVQAYSAVLDATTASFLAADQTKLGGISIGAEVNPALISQAEVEAGVGTTERTFNALRIAQAVTALSPPMSDADVKTAYENNADTNAFSDAEQTKVGNITVTQAVDLDTIETRVNALDTATVLAGLWDASAGTFPSTTTAGMTYIVSVAGTVGGIAFNVDDRLLALVNTPSTTVYATNWLILDYTDKVLSVAGRTGAVVLAKVDVGLSSVDNTSDANKPVSTAQQTALDLKEAADATILKDADIGVSVLAFDTNLQAFVTAFTVPTVDGTSGQALVTNGSGSIAFGDVDALPSQTGNSGKYLSTNGTDPSWATVGEFVYTRTLYTATSGQTAFNATYDAGYVDVFLNGIKILLGTEFTATNGTSITLATGAVTGDLIEILAHSTYNTIVELKNADGGFANSTYTSVQSVNGGSA